MRISIKYIIFVATILGTISCQNNSIADTPSYLLTKKIPDWNEIYPLLLITAQKWDPDAGLRLAVLEINSKNYPDRHLVSAFFETPTDKVEYLVAQYLEDGSVKTEILTRHSPRSNLNIIDNTEWMNSTDAWNLFLQNPDVVSFDPKFFDCATLILINKQLGYGEEKRVIWQLALDDCREGDLTMFLIDAKSGELLGKESH